MAINPFKAMAHLKRAAQSALHSAKTRLSRLLQSDRAVPIFGATTHVHGGHAELMMYEGVPAGMVGGCSLAVGSTARGLRQ
jgi:hypothetical protein